MRTIFLAVPALLLAAGAAAQNRPSPLDPQAKVPPVEYRSAFERYRPFAEQELADWRKANAVVAAGNETSRPQPGKPQTSGQGSHK